MTLIKYTSHKEIIFYVDHALYGLDKTKMTFENYCLINTKLFKSSFIHPKFYVIKYFLIYIKDYRSKINSNIAYSETIHKYLLKAFYEQIHNKKYNSWFSKHNIHHINIFSM